MIANTLLSLALSALGVASVGAAPADPSGQLSLGNLSQSYTASVKKPAGTVTSLSVTPNWDYGGSKKVRGVNLGGWLVAEPWITPSLFEATGDNRVIDEWTLGQYVSDARSRLQQHWASWITEDDIRQIAAAGLNHLRIPIGYWAFDTSAGEPYIQDAQFDYLKKAVGWASNYGLKVHIDLHGAPGSQNGFDNSGRKGSIGWPNDPNNANRAKACLTKIAQAFVNQQNTVTMIEAVNEPFMVGGPGNMDSYTKQYYFDAYGTIRYDASSSQSQYVATFSDGFEGLPYWQGFMSEPAQSAVAFDLHSYTVFSPQEIAQSQQARLNEVCSKRSVLSNNMQYYWTIVGEWTSATTDCAKYLNGRGVGARYDGSYPGSTYNGDCSSKTGDGSNFSSAYKTQLKQMFETQTSVYEEGSGWIYWTWKTESAADWDYQRQLAMGIIPSNLDNRQNIKC